MFIRMSLYKVDRYQMSPYYRDAVLDMDVTGDWNDDWYSFSLYGA